LVAHAVRVRVLLLEDDRRLGPLVTRGLRAEGHAVDPATGIEEARWLATENEYDVLVFDIVVPDGDGLDLCAELRQAGNWTPCLLLTARSAVPDRVRGLDVGADDYLVKPFAFDELLARMRAVSRRAPVARPSVIEVGGLRIDPASRLVTVNGTPVELHGREYAILELLARRPGIVIDRATIMAHVWDWAYEGASNVVDVHVHGIRTRLGEHAGCPVIETIRGVGYVLQPAPAPTGGRP
jgi:two-component system OmpR family response regulator